ncbi:MAG: hypothetical protein RJB34_64 [Pseudomonadota bacterium]|jgi:hypothetical protein
MLLMIWGLLRRERVLGRYALLMLALLCVAGGLWLFDMREVREVNVWVKPMKFMAATAFFALTTAVCLALLPAQARALRSVHIMVGVSVLTSAFEVGYITLQGALGNGSHYNVSSLGLALMFGLMALAAVGLTATQGVLAWVVHRHGLTWGEPVFVRSVVVGLGLTFVLATVSGFVLGGLQPPPGQGLPVLGWHLSGGDARPAHFLGVHANQLLPLLGLALMQAQWRGLNARTAMALLYAGVALYVLAWGWWLSASALAGRVA